MLGVLLSSRGLHSLAELVFAYPYTVYQDYLTYFDSVHTNKSLSAVSTLDNARADQKESVLGLPCAVLADLLCPKSELCDKVLDVTVELVRFIGFPVLTETFDDKRMKRRPSRIFGLDMKSKAETGEQLISFDVAFALDITNEFTWRKAQQLKEALCAFCKCQIGAYLKYEEARDGFLTKGISKIKQLASGRQDRESATYDAIEGCKLAQHLRDLFLNLKDTGEARLLLNDWLSCVISINFTSQVELPKLHQTLLLLEIPQRLEEQLPVDCSPVLINLIHGLKFPIKSLEELQLELCLSKEVVLAAAEHLIMWQKARAISVLSQYTLVATNPNGNYTPRLANTFRSILSKKHEKSTLTLAQIMSKFERPRTIKDLVAAEEGLKAKDYIAIVTWMLRHGLLVECKTRVYVQHSNILDPIMSAATIVSGTGREAFSQYLETLPKSSESYPVLEKILMQGKDFCDVEDLIHDDQIALADIQKAVAYYSDVLTLVTLVP